MSGARGTISALGFVGIVGIAQRPLRSQATTH